MDGGLLPGRDSIKMLAGLEKGKTDASLRGDGGLEFGLEFGLEPCGMRGGLGIRSRS